MVEKWLITGGCGFLGRNLISNLQNEGKTFIRIVDNLKVGTKEDLSAVTDFSEISHDEISSDFPSGKVELITGDILDKDLAMQACEGMDVIVHLAANTGVAPSVADPRMDCENNVIGTFNYLEAARKNNVKRFVFASSGAPAGEVSPPIHEEMPPHPVSPYGASKLAGEGYCSAYFRSFGVATVCLRFGNVYGPLSGKKDSVVAKFIKKAINGEPLEIYGDGSQTRDFIYIDDLIQAVCLAARAPKAGGEVFQIASNRETTVLEMVKILEPLLTKYGFDNLKIVYGEKRQGDVMRNFSDTSKAKNVLGWICDHELVDGLSKTVDWFCRRK
jgi:UDP-glucose 4-epimerase